MSANDSHELVSAVKDLAIELQRTPTRAEFEARFKGANYRLVRFGGFTALLHAAGLDTYDDRRSGKKRIISSEDIFGRDVAETIESHTPKERTQTPPVTESILAIGDAHFPFVHLPTLEKIYEFARQHQPKHIVQMGDLYDLYAHSRFPRSLNLYSPDEEIEQGRKGAEEMWRRLRDACPDAKLYLLTGNHDVRPLKNVLAKAPELEALVRKGLRPYFEFEGVTTVDDYREFLEIQGVFFHHGYLSQAGAHRDYNQRNMVTAHSHKGSVTYRPLAGKTLWELNAGFIGDETSKVMGYMPTKVTNWTLGFGYIDEHGPRFIPA